MEYIIQITTNLRHESNMLNPRMKVNIYSKIVCNFQIRATTNASIAETLSQLLTEKGYIKII